MFQEQVSRLLRTDWSKMSPNMLAEELALLLSTLVDLVQSGRLIVDYEPQTDDDASVEFSACGGKGYPLRLKLADLKTKTVYDAIDLADCVQTAPEPPLGVLTGQVIGKTSGSVTQGGSVNVDVYEGLPGKEKATGATISAYSPFGNVDAGKWVKCTHNGWGWYITAAEC